MRLTFSSFTLVAMLGSLVFFSGSIPSLYAENVQRGQMEDILKIVSADVQKNFYDPSMKGLDWAALTEQARKNIRGSDNMGRMILAIVALLDNLADSHTSFVPPQLTQYAYFGFSARAYGDEIRVYSVDNKGPAAKSGLEIGDQITSLNDIPIDRGNFDKIFHLLQAVVPAAALDAKIRTTGGEIKVSHIPAHMVVAQEHQYIESVWRVADKQRARDAHITISHREYGEGISYAGIPSFRADPSEIRNALKAGERSKVFILDLRGNHGGYRDTLLDFLGFFGLPPSVLAKRVTRSQSEDLTIKPRYSGFNGSLVVLVDSESASAAELAARYLQMNYKAQIVGDRTSGKVNESILVPGKIGAGFALPFGVFVTEAKLVMPDGMELEGRGVTPDSVCIPTVDDLRHQRDPCLDRAIELAKRGVGAVPPRMN